MRKKFFFVLILCVANFSSVPVRADDADLTDFSNSRSEFVKMSTYIAHILSKKGVFLYNGAPDELTGGKSGVVLGGVKYKDFPTYANLNIVYAPDGSYNAGCTICILSTRDMLQSGGGRAAISEGDWRGGGGGTTQAVGNFDAVSEYNFADSFLPKVIVEGNEFDPNGVVLSRQLSVQELSSLRVGQYVLTNVKNPEAINRWPAGELPSNMVYGGFLIGWSSILNKKNESVTYLKINGWAVPGGVNNIGSLLNSKYQFPKWNNDKEKLDNYFSQYSTPMVFIGSPQKMFLSNWFMHYEEPEDLSKIPMLMHEWSFGEWDFTYKVNTPHSLDFSGLVINPQQSGGRQSGVDPFTARSQDLWLGGAVPTLIKLNPNARSVEIESDRGIDNQGSSSGSIFVNKWTANDDLQPGSHPLVGKSFISSEYNNLVGSQRVSFLNRIVQTSDVKNGAGVDWRLTSMLSGSYAKDDGIINGSIQFHQLDGSLSFCVHDVLCSDIDKSGNFLSSGDVVSGIGKSFIMRNSSSNYDIYFVPIGDNSVLLKNNTIKSQNFVVTGKTIAREGSFSGNVTYADLLRRKEQMGTQLYCVDCFSNLTKLHHAGIPVWYNGKEWTDALGGLISSASRE